MHACMHAWAAALLIGSYMQGAAPLYQRAGTMQGAKSFEVHQATKQEGAKMEMNDAMRWPAVTRTAHVTSGHPSRTQWAAPPAVGARIHARICIEHATSCRTGGADADADAHHRVCLEKIKRMPWWQSVGHLTLHATLRFEVDVLSLPAGPS